MFSNADTVTMMILLSQYSRATHSVKKQCGAGLIELMLSVIIGLLVMAGVVQMYSTSSQNVIADSGASLIQDNMRFTFSRLARDLGETGSLGCVSSTFSQNISTSNNGEKYLDNMLGLSAGEDELYDFDTIINGVESATAGTDPAGLIAEGTDTFRIRYASNTNKKTIIDGENRTQLTLDNVDALRVGQIALATDCGGGSLFVITSITGNVVTHAAGSGPDQFNATSERDERVGVFLSDDGENKTENATSSAAYLYAHTTGAYQYFIGTSAAATATGDSCNPVSTTGGRKHCALFRRENGENLEIAEGVHDMQVEYGWNTPTNELFFTTAGGVTDWDDIDRVKVTLSFNSVENAAASAGAIDSLLERSATRIFHLSNQLSNDEVEPEPL
jgi:type IV pilus assembly protein PilW